MLFTAINDYLLSLNLCRVSDFGSEGWAFESSRVRHFFFYTPLFANQAHETKRRFFS